MFAVDWLKGGSPIERETIGGKDQTEAVAKCRKNAAAVAKRTQQQPDSFRLWDSSGRLLGVFSLRHPSAAPKERLK
jgi:hypothetical protein